jgi:dGTPase
MAARTDRPSNKPPEPDQRTAGQVDRDRILYSSEFRRLSGVTQVVSPGQEEIFHNRLTHTLKVAQLARRLAEHFCKHQSVEARSWGGIDPDVVEAAALAHDLGHPPLGHLAEEQLNDCIREVFVRYKHKSVPQNRADWKQKHKDEFGRAEGYEGNAQSFRIITRLAVRRHAAAPHALDLTRATLNATLKYPKRFDPSGEKYGCYTDDKAAFDFAREVAIPGGDCPSIEAQVMDWADDIA